jgi:oligoendopeptidase F
MNELSPMEWETVQPHVDALLAEELHAGNVEAWLRQWSDLAAALQEQGARVYREVTENTASAEAEARFNHWVEAIVPRAQVAEQALKEKLLAVEGYEPAPESAQMVKRFRGEAAIFREENVPIQSKLMKLGNRYDQIAGGMTVDWDGIEETLPQAELHLQDAARATREKAWRLIMNSYLEARAPLNELYLELLALRRQVAKNAGFDNFLEYQWQALSRFDYSPEDCQTFHMTIENEVVPLAADLYAQLQRTLDVDSLRPWDLKVDPHGKPLTPFEDAATLEDGGNRIFEQVDPVLGSHFSEMRARFLDLASRPNKAPGGYCNSFPISGKPYIFMNAVGTHRDVVTLLHEGGHAFHFMESKQQPLVWNQDAPMEFMEVASMAMELLGAPYLSRDQGGFYDDAQARQAYAEQLRDIVFFFPYMAVVDAFQHWVYTTAPEDVTADELDAKWSQIWDRFMAGIDYGGLQEEKETGWHRKAHIFTVPLYYVEYGLAQLGALQVWRNALDDQPRAVAQYRQALALGDTRPVPELFEAAGASFIFEREPVGKLMALVRDKLASLQDKAA